MNSSNTTLPAMIRDRKLKDGNQIMQSVTGTSLIVISKKTLGSSILVASLVTSRKKLRKIKNKEGSSLIATVASSPRLVSSPDTKFFARAPCGLFFDESAGRAKNLVWGRDYPTPMGHAPWPTQGWSRD